MSSRCTHPGFATIFQRPLEQVTSHLSLSFPISKASLQSCLPPGCKSLSLSLKPLLLRVRGLAVAVPGWACIQRTELAPRDGEFRWDGERPPALGAVAGTAGLWGQGVLAASPRSNPLWLADLEQLLEWDHNANP